ncbi:MAG: IclR family transcriptional regulator domain-containing protein, partial [Microbacterium sp.]
MLQSAERTLKVVQLLVQRGALSLTEVARELDISPSMAHRLLATCCATGFARQDAPSGAYTAGPALQEISLGPSGAATLRETGAATLARVHKELGETVSVVVLEGRAVRFVETLEGDGLIRVAAPLGRTLAAHATAAGRALLACLPTE